MAGAIFKKLRGLLAKFWAELQLFLKAPGLRVEYGKVGGLFNKMARAKGYGWISAVGSRSGGLDLKDPRSNLDHSLTIGWLWWSGSVTGGGTRRRAFPAAARDWVSPALDENGHPGTKSSANWL